MSEFSGSEADRQDQVTPALPDAPTASGTIADAGTGGSEADRQDQGTPAHPDDATAGGGIDGGGTGGSEADRLEWAASVPDDGEDTFSRSAEEDGLTP
ncbi:hypothetical protein [Arthrobacter sp. CP30]